MRAFLAVDLSPERRSEGGDDEPAPRHLTLRFLGEVDEATVGNLGRALAPAVRAHRPFEFVVEGVGAFPSRERPRVVWRGVGPGREDLVALARTVRTAVVAAGLEEDPLPFVPHVTLFRVRSREDRERASALLAPGGTAPPPFPVRVGAVDLKESRLTVAGAVHRTLARFPLVGRGP